MKTVTTPTKIEIALEDMGIADEVLIRTLHSLYKFLIIDPVKYYGLLTGGVLKDAPVSAFLCMTGSLRTGSCARFFVGLGDRHKVLRTSIIMNLTHITRPVSNSSESHSLQSPSSPGDRVFGQSSLASHKSRQWASG